MGPSVWVLCVAIALGGGGCSSNGASAAADEADGGLGGGGFDPGRASDATTARDTAPANTSADGAGADAGCGLPRTALGGTCDECVQTNCEPVWCTCAEQFAQPAAADAGSVQTDDGGGGADAAGSARADADAGSADAGSADAGSADAGSADAGSADAGSADAGSADAGSADAGSADAGGPGGATGEGGCQGYAQCVEGCVARDAGSPTACFQTVCAIAAYTPTAQQAGHAFLDCLVQYCASECGE